MKITQKHIDNGFIGGIINTYMGSRFIFSFIQVFTFILVLNTYLIDKANIVVPLWQIATIWIILDGMWTYIYFVYLQKSMQKQGNRQIFIDTNHPIMREFELLNLRFDSIEQRLKP